MPPSRAQNNYANPETKKKAEEKYGTLLKITTGIIFLVTLGVLVWWTLPQFQQFTSTGIGTTVRISARDNIEFPAVTLCNLMPNVTLRFQACTNPDGTACKGARRDDTGDYSCTTFNYDYRTPLKTTKSGLLSLLTMQFSISKDLYPPGAGLFGAQVVLHEPGTVPEVDKQAIFVSPGMATVLTLRRTQTNHLKPPKSIGGVTLGWDASPSLLAIDPTLFKADELVVVGVMYRELNVLEIDEIVLYPFGQFLGNFAGMVGTLLGLDVLNGAIMLVTGLFAFFAARQVAKERRNNPDGLENGNGSRSAALIPLRYGGNDSNGRGADNTSEADEVMAQAMGVPSARSRVPGLRFDGSEFRGNSPVGGGGSAFGPNDDDGGMASPRGGGHGHGHGHSGNSGFNQSFDDDRSRRSGGSFINSRNNNRDIYDDESYGGGWPAAGGSERSRRSARRGGKDKDSATGNTADDDHTATSMWSIFGL
jgi:hypothetical protein